MARNKNEEEIDISYNLKEWRDYPVGTYKKSTKNVEEAIEDTMERLVRIVPSIKKSSKILVFSSGSAYPAIFLVAKSGCKVECIASTEKAEKKIKKEVEQAELEENITVSTKPFSKSLFLNNTFDMVWSIAENYRDEEALDVFREVARVLVPEGRFILCHSFRSADNDQSELAIIDQFLKKASNADLERVYVKELKTESLKHTKNLLDKVKLSSADQDELKYKLQRIEDDQFVWAFLVFQKRNI